MMNRICIILASCILLNPVIKGQHDVRPVTSSPSFIIEYQKPVRFTKTKPGAWSGDFGRDAFGTMVITLKTDRNDTITLRLGEKLSDNGAIDGKPGGSIRYTEIKLLLDPDRTRYEINLPRDKRNTSPPAVMLPDSFGVIMPFRYFEIESGNTHLPTPVALRKTFFYRFNDEAADFTSSDTILNKIWDLCKYSIKATSFAGYYIDGDRERIPYEADAYINQLGHYCVDNEYSLARRTNEYFITHPTWPTEWILHTVLMYYHDYMYTGDISLLRKYYKALKAKTLVSLEREDGLISTSSSKLTDDVMKELGFTDTKQRIRDIVDWPPAQKDTGWKLATSEGERDGYEMVAINTVVNSLHYYNLVVMNKIASWLGENEDAVWYRERAELVKQSVNSRLFDRSKGIYVDGEGSMHSSLHANMFPLACGIVPEEKKAGVINFIKSRGMACSVYGSQFLLEGLFESGESSYALSLLTSTSDRSWWNMIRTGSTITMEAWDMKYKPNSDWNHAWGAAPANIITRFLWGIKPSEPGFRKAVIKPALAGLKSTSIKVPTANGPIRASYQDLPGNAGLFTIDLPSGTSADFIIPPGRYRTITLNGNTIRKNNLTINLPGGKNEIRLQHDND
ncbi:MAG: family 78 glycoside hydrolase catalytic domain [Bacteroidales bacterium]